MRKSAKDALFPTVRRELLGTLLLHPKKSWYLSELVRHLGRAASQLHGELASLTEAGILERRVEGRQTYFAANPACPYLPELTGLLQKLMGADEVLRNALAPYREKILSAFIYGSIAKGEETAESDIDLMIVGDVTVSEFLPELQKAEKKLGREINPTIYPVRELAQKFKAGHHFARSVLKHPAKTFLIGTRRELEKAASGKQDQAAQDKQGGDRRAAPGRRRKAKRR
jgi:predicted nucleotidyltransferase